MLCYNEVPFGDDQILSGLGVAFMDSEKRYIDHVVRVEQNITASVWLLKCTDCGAIVADKEIHDRWHELTPAFHWNVDHGTSGGVELTEEKVQELADEAERGYDPSQLKDRDRHE